MPLGENINLDFNTTNLSGSVPANFPFNYVNFDTFNAYAGSAVLSFELDHYVPLDIDGYHGANATLDDFETNPVDEFDADAHHGANATLDDFENFPQFDADGYHGADGQADLEINPPDEFDVPVHHGANVTLDDLENLPQFDADGYHGAHATSEVEINPADEFDADAHHGANATLDDFENFPQFDGDAYHGADGQAELETAAGEAIAVDGYHGANVTLDDLENLPQFDVDGYHGADGQADLEISPSEPIDGDAYHGAYADASLAPTIALPLDPAYHGASGTVDDIKFATTFDADGYHGADATLNELETPVAPTIDSDAYHGSNVTLDSFSVTRAIFPRGHHGANVEGELETFEAAGLSLDFYHGANVTFDELDEFNWNTLAYHGANVTLDDIEITQNFQGDAHHGIAAEFDVLNVGSYELEVDAYHGAAISVDFTAVLGEPLSVNAYHGANVGVDVSLIKHPLLIPRAINASASMYDGSTNVNWCDEGLQDEAHLDNVIRFDPANPIYINFDPDGYIPWDWDCFTPWAVFHADLEIYPRFSADAYEGGAIKDSAIDSPILLSFGNIELPYLYYNIGEWQSSYGNEFSQFAFGSGIDVYLTTDETFRFCRGYILPVGESVILEFTDITLNCESTYLTHGANMSGFLSSNHRFYPHMPHGAHMEFILTVDKPWLLHAYHGAHVSAWMPSTAEMGSHNSHGSHIEFQFEELPIKGYHGAHIEFELVVAGSGLEWITPTGELKNTWLTVTPEGDPDPDAMDVNNDGIPDFFTVAVEKLPFQTWVVAKCVTFIEGDE